MICAHSYHEYEIDDYIDIFSLNIWNREGEFMLHEVV